MAYVDRREARLFSPPSCRQLRRRRLHLNIGQYGGGNTFLAVGYVRGDLLCLPAGKVRGLLHDEPAGYRV
jgi:hypothetical protein